jgi:hypothetical protein
MQAFGVYDLYPKCPARRMSLQKRYKRRSILANYQATFKTVRYSRWSLAKSP